MSRRAWAIAVMAATVAVGAAALTREHWWPAEPAQKGARPAAARVVPVETATSADREVPVRVEALGTVQPMATVAIKARLESEIVSVHFEDGAAVKAGDLLFRLDSRSLEAQILQAEGVLARDRAQLEGAERDIRRFTELVSRNSGTRVSLENAETQADMLRGTVKANESALKNLRVLLSYTEIRAPLAGRISAASVKAGNFVRPADIAPLATINQTSPVYVGFGVPQRLLPDIRRAMQSGDVRVEALAPGEGEPSAGRLAMVDNLVDVTTGMITVRAIMENADESLWPGALVRVVVTLRVERAVTVPTVAVQSGQSGNYVFVVQKGAVAVRPVTVTRTHEGDSVIAHGLAGGEVVVTDGQLLLTDGTRVSTRQRKAGS